MCMLVGQPQPLPTEQPSHPHSKANLPPRSSIISKVELQEKRSTAPYSSSVRDVGRASSSYAPRFFQYRNMLKRFGSLPCLPNNQKRVMALCCLKGCPQHVSTAIPSVGLAEEDWNSAAQNRSRFLDKHCIHPEARESWSGGGCCLSLGDAQRGRQRGFLQTPTDIAHISLSTISDRKSAEGTGRVCDYSGHWEE